MARNIFFVAVLALYIVSTMGYGVHKCSTDGTASLILLFGESPCEYVHSHVDEYGNTYTHSHAPGMHDQACSHGYHDCEYDGTHRDDCCAHHSGEHHDEGCAGHHHEQEHDGCCSTDVYVLTQDQKTVEDNISFLPQPILVADVMQDMLAVQAPAASLLENNAQFTQTLHHEGGQQALLCTFRI